jgi:hypothetical protein
LVYQDFDMEKIMKREVGIWIDHRKAVIVKLIKEGDVTQEIKSNIEKHVRFSGGSHSKAAYKSHQATAEDMRDRQYMDHLGGYYELIVSLIRDADSMLIFGPGEAKGELQKSLMNEGLGGRIVGIETVDKMTDRQIAAKVRGYFKA